MNTDQSTNEKWPVAVHCADLHLDSPFYNLSSDLSKALKLREEQLQVFSRIIVLARKTGSSLLLIAGDLFDAANVTAETLDFVNQKFASIPDVSVFIAAGNHDPLTPESPYSTYPWAENVHIFGDELSYFELGNIRVYGRSFAGHFTGSALLAQADGSLPELDDSFVNILLLHGDTVTSSSVYNPIDPDDLGRCGFDYAALGHFHTATPIAYAGATPWCYPGIPQGRGFDEDGDKGVMLLQIGKKSLKSKFVNTCLRHYVLKDVDVTGCEGNEDICSNILAECPAGHDLYKVNLTGSLPETFIVSAPRLETMLADKYFFIKVKDSTGVDANIELLQNEASVKGIFVKNIMEAVASDKLKSRALKFGLQAFEGDVMIDEDR